MISTELFLLATLGMLVVGGVCIAICKYSKVGCYSSLSMERQPLLIPVGNQDKETSIFLESQGLPSMKKQSIFTKSGRIKKRPEKISLFQQQLTQHIMGSTQKKLIINQCLATVYEGREEEINTSLSSIDQQQTEKLAISKNSFKVEILKSTG